MSSKERNSLLKFKFFDMKIFDKIFGSNSEDKPSIVTRDPLLERDIKSIDEYKTPQIDNEKMERLKKK